MGAMNRAEFQGGDRMKNAIKKATSELLAQMLAVTAMLVIAGVVFYWR